MNFNHLEAEIPSQRNLYCEVGKQSHAEARVSRYWRDITWKNKYLHKDNKVKISKTRVDTVKPKPITANNYNEHSHSDHWENTTGQSLKTGSKRR